MTGPFEIDTLVFAALYREACKAVQPAWEAQAKLPFGHPHKHAAAIAYREACEHAVNARNVLLTHVRAGIPEIAK
jgi:hypothetical protein